MTCDIDSNSIYDASSKTVFNESRTSVEHDVIDGECFGLCGLGCLAPGKISTPECVSHDTCVENYGHADCLYNPPDDPETGESYSSLGEAALSYANELFSAGGGSSMIDFNGPYYTPPVGSFCTYDIYCIDNPFSSGQIAIGLNG